MPTIRHSERNSKMKIFIRLGIIIVGLLLIPLTAVATAALKQRFEDGPNRVFSGGPLLAGELHAGAEPDWSFVNSIPTIEMQLLEPGTSRRIWVASYDNKLYVWSGYMNSVVGRIWKQWPVQAEADGRAVMRIDGVRYERDLQRVTEGDFLPALSDIINSKYSSSLTPASVSAGEVWLFEATPRD